MFKFTKTGLFVLLNLIIFFVLQFFIHKYSISTEINEEIMKYDEMQEIPVNQTAEKATVWKIEIPKISLIANISQGTTHDVLKQNVGHFKNTPKQQGNIVLAAYSRGHEMNYFKDLKILKKGDEIKYQYNNFEKIYKVEKCRIIRNSEWEFLEDTEENMLTLITYVENQPEYRRCVQAIEKIEVTNN